MSWRPRRLFCAASIAAVIAGTSLCSPSAVASDEAKTQDADALLDTISTYLTTTGSPGLGNISGQVRALAEAREAIQKAEKGSVAYQDALDLYKSTLDAVRKTIDGDLKELKTDEDFKKIVKWDSEAFKSCATVPLSVSSNPDPKSQPAGALKSKIDECTENFKAARENLQKYIDYENGVIDSDKSKLVDLQKQYDEAKSDKDKDNIKKQIDDINQDIDKAKHNVHHAEDVKKQLSFGDILLAIGELLLGIVEGVACVEGGDASSCVQAGLTIADAVGKLTDGEKEQKDIESSEETPKDKSVVAKEDEVRNAASADKDEKAASDFEKSNPDKHAIPTNGSGNLFLTQSISANHVQEVDIVDGSSKTVILTATDDALFVSADNAALAGLSKFSSFNLARRVEVPGDKKTVLVALSGSRVDGSKGEILLRLAPLPHSGKIPAVGRN